MTSLSYLSSGCVFDRNVKYICRVPCKPAKFHQICVFLVLFYRPRFYMAFIDLTEIGRKDKSGAWVTEMYGYSVIPCGDKPPYWCNLFHEPVKCNTQDIKTYSLRFTTINCLEIIQSVDFSRVMHVIGCDRYILIFFTPVD